MDTQSFDNESKSPVKRTRWWFRTSLTVAGLVILITIISLVFGSFGPLTSPVKFFLEEILLEELIGISDFFYSTYPYSLGLVTTISALFYAFVVGIIVWGIERHKVVKSTLILSATVLILGFMWAQGLQLAFFNFQCVVTQTPNNQSKLFSLSRACPIKYSPYFSIPFYLYNSVEPQTVQMFEDMVIADEEFERIKQHNGNIRYFCRTGCELNRFNHQCRSVADSTCQTCTDACHKDYRASKERIGHIVDLLKSESFQRCINRCRP